jgi:hypothetical protein
MKKLHLNFIGISILLLTLFSCKSILQERLENGVWNVQIIRYNSTNIYNKLRTNMFVFNKDGTASFDDLQVRDLKTEKWFLNKDTLIIEGNSVPYSGKYITELQIDPETNVMTLYLKSDSTEIKMTSNPNPLDKLLKH